MSQIFKRLWESSASLTFVGVLMLVDLAISIVGLIADPTVITGAPAWLKPTKFAISTGIYSFTLAWLLTYVSVWPRLMRWMARTVAFVIVFEIVLIDIQAARGIPSHFNNTTPLNAILFGVMGIAIGLLLLCSAVIAAALFRQVFTDRAWGWALRIGMSITVVGASLGGMMLRPTSAQLENARSRHQMPTVGAHTVGAPDGDSGLPLTAWSTRHGDLRVPHFFGMHAVQMIPFLAWLLACVRPALSVSKRVLLIQIASAGYVALTAILLWQALRGQSIIEPDQATLVALAACAALTILAATAVVLRNNTQSIEAAARV
jgi:hypothetical protein